MGIGKGASLKKFITSSHFRQQAKVFQGIATTEEIAASGGNALALLYNGKAGQCLDNLRYQRYQEKLATKPTQIQPNSLPRHRLQQNSIVFACMPKSCNGKGEESMPKTGGGRRKTAADSCDDGFTSSTRQPSTHSEMQLLIGMQHAAMFPAASTTWNVLLHWPVQRL
ncbi:hypothetical protein OS493_019598 [Desmophyllum pertusum]|uniref:Uncharacterized protein n=1 Tax=Desmophyllum pertusum TaxID=174260 RepID=A0A9W9ZD99_9CNID|nr:hypothetical protein OS493_019598 [Desmophyllum pertusum]